MKEDEIKFFRLCYRYISKYSPRELINIIIDFIPYKRCWYYLDKWDRLGFYNYGVTEDLGWFEKDKIPPRYMELVKGDDK